MSDKKGVVFEFYRGTTHDGPGMRTTAFLKGCPLNCRWCHNPEGISPKIENWWNQNKCIGCNICVNTCPNGAITFTEMGLTVDKSQCTMCGACVKNCPSKALQHIGTEYTTASLVKELLKDDMFFDCFGGGITLSGGDPTLQPAFLLDVLKGLKSKGKNTAVDTCGYCQFETLAHIAPYTDTFLFDIKFMDSTLHREYTDVDNGLILDNFRKLVAYINDNHLSCDIWVRTPIIPHATDSLANIREIAEFLSIYRANISRYELCAFNNVCKDKYHKLNQEWYYDSYTLMSESQISLIKEAATDILGDLVLVSGLTTE